MPSTPSEQYATFLKVAVEAAKSAGAVIMSAFNQSKSYETKGGEMDLVTETDKQCEELVQGALKREFPMHRFIGEEGSAAQGFTSELTDEPTWMCDPLDGTTNFIHAFPFVCVSIALVIEKRVVVGVVYNPVLKELFTATQGGGAFLNDQRISTSSTTSLGSSLVTTEVGYSRDEPTVTAIFARMRAVAGAVRALRCCGSCACNLTSVAMGRADAFYEIGFGGCWDVAAGSLIVEEAGGRVMDPSGGDFDVMGRRVLAANGYVGAALANILAECPVSETEPKALSNVCK